MAHSGLKVLDSDMRCMEPPDLSGRDIADPRIVIDGRMLPRHSSHRAHHDGIVER